MCGVEYVPGSGISKYCPACAKRIQKEKSNESKRRSREQKRMVCIELSAKNDRLTRSGLFYEMIRVIKELRNADRNRGQTAQSVRPRWCVWENVPGAYSSGEPPGEDLFFFLVFLGFFLLLSQQIFVPVQLLLDQPQDECLLGHLVARQVLVDPLKQA